MKKIFKLFAAVCAFTLSAGSFFSEGAAQSEKSSKSGGAKSIVIYFSRADENYSVGTVAKGNTQVLAEIIASETGSDMFKIEPVTPYAKDYNTCIRQAQDDLRKKVRPEIKASMSQTELDKYDTVYFGTPVYWGDLPMACYTFIEKLNWSGKKICFFGTHEGSGISGIKRAFKNAAKNCLMQDEALSMFGHDAQKNDEKEKTAVKNWLKEVNN